MLVRAAREEDKAWIVGRVGCLLTPLAKGIAVEDSAGDTKAVVLWDLWTETMAVAHIAVASPMALRVLCREGFPWFFRHREIMTGQVRASNTRALELNKHLGFSEVLRLKDGFAVGDDLVLLEMRRADCRWLDDSRMKEAA